MDKRSRLIMLLFLVMCLLPELAGAVVFGNEFFLKLREDQTVFTSPDGIKWTAQTSLKSDDYAPGGHVSAAKDMFFVLTVDENYYGVILSSQDGRNWTSTTLEVRDSLRAVTYGNGLFVAVGGLGTILTSPDGLNWTQRSSGTTAALSDVTFGDNTFVAVGFDAVLTSEDGENWVFHDLESDFGFTELNGITYGDGLFVAVGVTSAYGEATVFVSTDGKNWSKTLSVTIGGAKFIDVAYGNGAFVVIGHVSYGKLGSRFSIFTSADGYTWTDKTPDSVGILTVAFGNDTFVGEGGISSMILTSPDGEEWIIRSIEASFKIDAVSNSAANVWLDTGINVAEGTLVTLTAGGTACLGSAYCQGPEGAPSLGDLNGCPFGSPVGKIGEGQQFCIGLRYQKVSEESGRLYLAYNDNDYSNNAGEFAISLTLGGEEVKPVYRFFNSLSGHHFYTISEAERDYVLTNLPEYYLVGNAFFAYSEEVFLTAPVHRFFNPTTGDHYYTISEDEKESLEQNSAEYFYVGIAYYAFPSQQAQSVPLYRFFNPTAQSHFYTASEAEKVFVMENLPEYYFEGIVYYVLLQ